MDSRLTSHLDAVSDALAELAALPAEVGVSQTTLVTHRGEIIASSSMVDRQLRRIIDSFR